MTQKRNDSNRRPIGLQKNVGR